MKNGAARDSRSLLCLSLLNFFLPSTSPLLIFLLLASNGVSCFFLSSMLEECYSSYGTAQFVPELHRTAQKKE